VHSGFEAFSDADATWREAIARLYEMTAEDRPDGPVEGCTHCKSQADMDLLGSIERETAPQWLMDDFAFSATLTWGSERDFRWFLPRILELLADHPEMASGPEIIASRLRMAGLDEWPEPEQELVRDVFVALWHLWLDGGRPWRRPWRPRRSWSWLHPSDILLAAGEVDVDAGPLLEGFAARALGDRPLGDEYASALELIAGESEEDLELFADPLADEPDYVAGRGDNTVVRFLASDEGIEQVEEVASHFADDELGERLRLLAQRLARLQTALGS
jgi:hypothetical protein